MFRLEPKVVQQQMSEEDKQIENSIWENDLEILIGEADIQTKAEAARRVRDTFRSERRYDSFLMDDYGTSRLSSAILKMIPALSQVLATK